MTSSLLRLTTMVTIHSEVILVVLVLIVTEVGILLQAVSVRSCMLGTIENSGVCAAIYE